MVMKCESTFLKAVNHVLIADVGLIFTVDY